jgi:hypothetical protein
VRLSGGQVSRTEQAVGRIGIELPLAAVEITMDVAGTASVLMVDALPECAHQDLMDVTFAAWAELAVGLIAPAAARPAGRRPRRV